MKCRKNIVRTFDDSVYWLPVATLERKYNYDVGVDYYSTENICQTSENEFTFHDVVEHACFIIELVKLCLNLTGFRTFGTSFYHTQI